jgi:hypothetical protein
VILNILFNILGTYFFAVVNFDLVQFFVVSAWTLCLDDNTTFNFPIYKSCAHESNSFNVNYTNNETK